MSRIIAVVVTYNRIELLKECLKALETQTYALDRIIVVDNCSSDGTREWLQNLSNDKYSVLLMEENIGGAGGFNRGMKKACEVPCDYVLVLDDDCILNDDYVEKLLKGSQEYIEKTFIDGRCNNICALCGTVFENGKIATNHRGYFVKHKLFPSLDYWREYNDFMYSSEYLVCDIASFCGLMISTDAVAKIGFPKEEYFIKYDDTEYSLRIHSIGKIINVNSSKINHKTSVDYSIKVFDWKYYYDIRNGINMTFTNKLYYCLVKFIVKSLILAVQNQKIDLWISAVNDGLKGRLGRNESRYKVST